VKPFERRVERGERRVKPFERRVERGERRVPFGGAFSNFFLTSS